MTERTFMRQIQQFFRLPANERRLLLRAASLVAAVRLGLWTAPFRTVRRILELRSGYSPELASIPTNRLVWAVQAAGRRVPGASCLTQALVLQRLLARAGQVAGVRIGVAKDAALGFRSHAWVVCGGEIVLGDCSDLDRYSPMLALMTREV